MRGWLTAIGGIACLLAALALPVAGQGQQAPAEATYERAVDVATLPPPGQVQQAPTASKEPVGPQSIGPSHGKIVFQRGTTAAGWDQEDKALDVADTPQTAKDLQVAEDLEIMGEVLRRALAELYPPSIRACDYPVGNRTSPRVNRNVSPEEVQLNLLGFLSNSRFRSLTSEERDMLLYGHSSAKEAVVERPEAAYLEDYGAVFHVRLDVAAPVEERPKDPGQQTDQAAVGAGPWESARRSLRGQPPEPRAVKVKHHVPTKTDLVNRLLDVLAENAANFGHLKPEERLTVAITFSRVWAPATSAEDQARVGIFDPTLNRGMVYEDVLTPDEMSSTLPATENPQAFDYVANVGEARGSHEVSGDLHMRQQNYRQAAEAYKKALEALGRPTTTWEGNRPTTSGPSPPTTTIRPTPRTNEALLRKLIQAYVGLGEWAKAQELIQKLLVAEPKGGHQVAPSVAPRPIPLPARLTVSVTQLELDEAAGGKITRQQLGKQAVVRYFNPPPSIPGLPPRASRASTAPQRRPLPTRLPVGQTNPNTIFYNRAESPAKKAGDQKGASRNLQPLGPPIATEREKGEPKARTKR